MEGFRIKEVKARQIYDSRANPTIEVDIVLDDDVMGRGMVPSGASTGKFEALELRDGGAVLDGKGVMKAVASVNDVLGPELVGMDVRDLQAIDDKLIRLDGTASKSKLGANAILGCSMAAAWAGANYYKIPLYRYLGGALSGIIPVPMVQIIGGGAHAAGVIDIQDFLVIPLTGATFAEAYRMVAEVYFAAKRVFARYGKPLSIADEGGFWPTGFERNEDGLALLTESIVEAGYTPGKDAAIALDIAASEFYNEESKLYHLNLEDKVLTSEQMVELLCNWANRYPIISIEDGVSELDWKGAALLTQRLGKQVQLIGDDLFTTNIKRIQKGVAEGCYNSVLIKMNQIGTISETIRAVEYTKSQGYLTVISARSGETEDATIAHLAVATGAGQLKVGSAARGERTAKWNEVLRIEEQLGQSAIYPAAGIFRVPESPLLR